MIVAGWSRPRWPIADDANSVVEITLDGKSHKARFYNRFASEQSTKIAEIDRFYAIQRRLYRLMNVTKLGGEQELAKNAGFGQRPSQEEIPPGRSADHGIEVDLDGLYFNVIKAALVRRVLEKTDLHRGACTVLNKCQLTLVKFPMLADISIHPQA